MMVILVQLPAMEQDVMDGLGIEALLYLGVRANEHMQVDQYKECKTPLCETEQH